MQHNDPAQYTVLGWVKNKKIYWKLRDTIERCIKKREETDPDMKK